MDIGSGVQAEVEDGCVVAECGDGFRGVVEAGEEGGQVGEFGLWDSDAGMSCNSRDVGGWDEGVLSGCEERLELAREGVVDGSWG